MVRRASLEAYESIVDQLTEKQRQVMACVYANFTGRTFTRKQLARALGWEINRVTGRVLELIEFKYLEEHGSTVEDGRKAALVRIRAPVEQLSLLEAA